MNWRTTPPHGAMAIAVGHVLAAGLVLGCGDGAAKSSAKVADASVSCQPLDASASGTCHTAGRVICNTGSVVSGSPVTVAAGRGALPVPAGGPLIDGAYELVAETLYGPAESNLFIDRVGDQVRAVLTVQCDVFNELYAVNAAPSTAPALSGGNACGRLTLQADAGDGVSYTSTGDMLYVITPSSYYDLSRGLALGTFEMVDAFERLPVTKWGPATPCVPAGSDTSRKLVAGMRDPGCPSNVPAPGTPCDPQPPPLECEYGGDAWGGCTTFAACAEQPDGGYQFQIAPRLACPPNPTECPATFSGGLALSGSEMAAAADAGSFDLSITCSYPEGVCGCLPCSSGCQWTCRARTDVAGSVDAASPCPTARPLAGDPCAHEGEQCDYDSLCEPELSLGPSMVCQHGNWVQTGAISSCPLFDPCSTPPPTVGPDAG